MTQPSLFGFKGAPKKKRGRPKKKPLKTVGPTGLLAFEAEQARGPPTRKETKAGSRRWVGTTTEWMKSRDDFDTEFVRRCKKAAAEKAGRLTSFETKKCRIGNPENVAVGSRVYHLTSRQTFTPEERRIVTGKLRESVWDALGGVTRPTDGPIDEYWSPDAVTEATSSIMEWGDIDFGGQMKPAVRSGHIVGQVRNTKDFRFFGGIRHPREARWLFAAKWDDSPHPDWHVYDNTKSKAEDTGQKSAIIHGSHRWHVLRQMCDEKLHGRGGQRSSIPEDVEKEYSGLRTKASRARCRMLYDIGAFENEEA